MAHFNEMVFHLGGVPVGSGLGALALAGGKVYFVDSEYGVDGNDGLTPAKAVKTVAAGYALTKDAHHDIVVLIPRPTQYAVTAALLWDNDYTHLIGAHTPIIHDQRCRLVAATGSALATMVTVSGVGCSFHNIKFSNEYASATAGCMKITGSRNYFNSCTIDITSATALAGTASYSLWISGVGETTFVNCTLGADATDAAGAGYTVIMDGGASKAYFTDCNFLTRASSSTSRVHVKFDASAVGMGLAAVFDNCLLVNTSTNWGVTMSDAFAVALGTTHYIVVKGGSQIVGITGWADNRTYVYVPNYTTTAALCSQTPAA
jgi:hypothetical protein